MTKVQNVYLSNAAIALQYCDVTGDKGSANLIRTNMLTVMEKIDGAFKQIHEMGLRATIGNDKLLVSGQVISKIMNTNGVSKGQRYPTKTQHEIEITKGFESVSDQTYQTMMERAKKRNLSLADDLRAAGFVDVLPDEGNRYLYSTGNAKYYGTVTRLDEFVDAMKLWAYSDANAHRIKSYHCNSRRCRFPPIVTKDDVLQVDFIYPQVWATLFLDAKTEFFVVPSYNRLRFWPDRDNK